MRRPKKALIFLVILNIIAYGVLLVVNNNSITYGINYQQMRQQIVILKMEDEILRDQLLDMESYREIASRAAAMGYRPY